MPKLTETQAKAKYLLAHPAEYGRRLGYTLLTDRLHDGWIRQIVGGSGDMTLQSHRGSYKTSCITVGLAEIMLLNPDKNIIFLRKTDPDVTEVLQSVRKILQHNLTQAIFEALTGTHVELIKGTNKQIITGHYDKAGGSPQLLGIGLGGSLTGKHADIIVTDDIVTRLDRQSKAERERTKAIYQELQNLRNPGGRIINCGTPWHKEDAFGLMPPPVRYDCYSTGLLTDAQIADLKANMAPSLFAANYELRHIAAEGALFTHQPETAKGEAKDLLRDGIAHIDAAYGGEDYTALTIAKRVGDHILLYGRLWHSHVDRVLARVLDLCKTFGCAPIYVELNGDKGYLAREIRESGYAAFGYTEHENKYVKISTYLRKWWRHIVLVPGTDPEYVSQILDYTDTAAHDDAPDSAACVCRQLDR